jgi:hypothetical protein
MEIEDQLNVRSVYEGIKTFTNINKLIEGNK